MSRLSSELQALSESTQLEIGRLNEQLEASREEVSMNKATGKEALEEVMGKLQAHVAHEEALAQMVPSVCLSISSEGSGRNSPRTPRFEAVDAVAQEKAGSGGYGEDSKAARMLALQKSPIRGAGPAGGPEPG